MRRENAPDRPEPVCVPRVAYGVPWLPESDMSTILIVLLILLLVGALPTWPYSSAWGYYPSGGLGLVLVVLLVLVLLGRV